MRYDEDGQDVLKGLSFVVEPGTKIGIVGKTGCGKTTFGAREPRLDSRHRVADGKGSQCASEVHVL